MSRNNLSYAYYMYCLLGQWHCARADNFDWDDWDECTIPSHVIFLFYTILPFVTSYHKKITYQMCWMFCPILRLSYKIFNCQSQVPILNKARCSPYKK